MQKRPSKVKFDNDNEILLETDSDGSHCYNTRLHSLIKDKD